MEQNNPIKLNTTLTPVKKVIKSSLVENSGTQVFANYSIGKEQITLDKAAIMLITNDNEFVTEGEMVLFAKMCAMQKLNPFTKEAYLIKYDRTKPASFVVGYDVLRKRADSTPGFDSLKEGIVVVTNEGKLFYRQGAIVLPSEKLVGGWAEVVRTDRGFPIRAEVSLEEYSSNQSTWKAKPATMIKKVAVTQCLRAAFPNQLSNLYIQDEFDNENKPSKPIYHGELDLKDLKVNNEHTLKDNYNDILNCDDQGVVIMTDEKEEEAVENNKAPNESTTVEEKTDIEEVPFIVSYTEYSNHKEKYARVALAEPINGFSEKGYNQETQELYVKLK